MDKLLVLVNGLPGSGKSTLAQSLSRELRAQLLSKDAIKEALATCIDDVAAVATLGAIAMDTLWMLARAISETVVVDSWWYRPRDLALARNGIEKALANRVVEVWCDVPADVAKARYRLRHRAPFYEDDQRLANDWPAWAEHAAPLGLTPMLMVDTAHPVDCAALAAHIHHIAGPPAPQGPAAPS